MIPLMKSNSIPFKFEFKHVILRFESDKAKICEPKREQKLWFWVRYIYFYEDRCVIIQVYPKIKKWEIPIEG